MIALLAILSVLVSMISLGALVGSIWLTLKAIHVFKTISLYYIKIESQLMDNKNQIEQMLKMSNTQIEERYEAVQGYMQECKAQVEIVGSKFDDIKKFVVDKAIEQDKKLDEVRCTAMEPVDQSQVN